MYSEDISISSTEGMLILDNTNDVNESTISSVLEVIERPDPESVFLEKYNQHNILPEQLIAEYSILTSTNSIDLIEYGMTPLMLASMFGHTMVVHDLLTHGVDPNIRNTIGTSAIMYAKNVEVLQELIKFGANVNDSYESGHTVLMSSIDNGYVDAVEVLIKAGADVNARTRNGHTVLMSGIIPSLETNDAGENIMYTPDSKFVQILINAGADYVDITQDQNEAFIIIDGAHCILNTPNIQETITFLDSHKARLNVIADFVQNNFVRAEEPLIKFTPENIELLSDYKKFSKRDIARLLGERNVLTIENVLKRTDFYAKNMDISLYDTDIGKHAGVIVPQDLAREIGNFLSPVDKVAVLQTSKSISKKQLIEKGLKGLFK